MNYSQHREFSEQMAARVTALADLVATEPKLHESARVLRE